MGTASDLNELIRLNLPEQDRARAVEFAEGLFAREPVDRVHLLSQDNRIAIALSGFALFSLRPEAVAVRVAPDSPAAGMVTVETLMVDRPFIVDSLLEYFHHLDAPIALMLHPIFRVSRDAGGGIVSLNSASAAEQDESFVHAELELNASPEDAERMTREIRAILMEVQQATDDFERMTARALQICEETAAQRELVEARDFLRWLVQGGFIFLGYRRYHVSGGDGTGKITAEFDSGLGVMREEGGSRFLAARSTDEFSAIRRKLLVDGPSLIVSKSGLESQVHRRRPMDSVTIRRTDVRGNLEGFEQFIGLFTSKAYAEEAQHIPVLRMKLREVLEIERATPGSHDYKEIVTAFNSFPKDELFRASVPELRDQLLLVLDVSNEATVRLRILADQRRGSVTVLVLVPREEFSGEVRKQIEQSLARGLGGTLAYSYVAFSERFSARLHFCFVAEPPKAQKIKELESEIRRIAHRWQDRLAEELVQKFGASRGRVLAERWTSALAPDYWPATTTERAVADIESIENLLTAGGTFHVVPIARSGEDASELRMLGIGQPPGLSELMPILQNLGIRVISEDFSVFKPQVEGGVINAYVQAFSVRTAEAQPLWKLPGAELVPDAIAAIRAGLAEDDLLNALVLTANLKWREVALLRAYLAAAFQMRLAPARPALRRVLIAQPSLARAMFDLFAALLDPDHETAPQKLSGYRAAYIEALGRIDNIADDRTARMLLSMVEATVRTNYFSDIPTPDPYIALKFESARITGLIDTPPLYEIHVNSPRMEGCHLRGGKVARGGIRFSDRPDDFRTEILGLMKTQTVKNAIIVPIGCKGGFIVKDAAPAGPPGVEAYKALIRAMLDLTDNLTDQGIVHPPRMKVLDTDGPYLVVAADKGTAAFSDIANEIAIERGFWLGDAFASGGEHGFDHKKMGITARGAWESARRHLREMGRDPDRGIPITMVGIGDMSGDVFGNGLLRSRNVRLVAAFDHRHIFIDPNPDSEASFEERKRLYDTPRSQWSDYNPALISKGGGVWRRGQKMIELSAEARAVLDTKSEALDGESLVSTILRAPVDLLYNGGIGTYVRGSGEGDAEVGDHANDSCRIAATELRARIVVEGGNLGFTQKARIEFALAGGRINTDAIDNSAGVDTSDHEVNLKILLEPEVARHALSRKERNQVLENAEIEVAASVLRDNRDQALLLSLEQVRSRTSAPVFYDHMQAIEAHGTLRRHEEALPTREALRERRSRFPGLTRPELALVTAYSKIDLVRSLDDGPLVKDPYLIDRFLRPYFPRSVAERFPASVGSHRLRHELIATQMVNELVDLMGSTFVFELTRDHGLEAPQAVRAWVIAGDVLSIGERTARVLETESLMTSNAELEAYLALSRACGSAAAWVVRNVDPEVSLGAAIARYRPDFERLVTEFEAFLEAGERDKFERIYRQLRVAVTDGELAHALARLAFAEHVLTVIGLSLARRIDTSRVAAVYFGMSATLDFSPLESALGGINHDDRWQRRALQELDDELRAARVTLCTALLDDPADIHTAMERINASHPRLFADVERLLAEVATMATPSLSAVHVTIRAISRLAAAHARNLSG